MILVTGSQGMIGRALVRLLVEGRQTVRAHTRQMLDFETAKPADFERLVNGCTTVVHTAGLVHNQSAPPELFQLLNVQATKMLAQAALRAGASQFVFLSTSAVYGSAFTAATENQPLCPETAYATAKIECELLLKEHLQSVKLVILRPSLVFGAGDRGNMLALIKQINKGMYVNIKANQGQKSLICATDLAQVIFSCLNQLADGTHIFNVASPQAISVNELGNIIAAGLGKAAPPAVPASLLYSAARAAQMVLGKRSPLNTERLDKLTASTTLSVNRLASAIDFTCQLPPAALAAEIAWARTAGLI